MTEPSSVRITTGTFLNTTTVPVYTGNFNASGWVKCNAGEYGGSGEHVPFYMGNHEISASCVGLVDIGAVSNSTIAVLIFTAGGGVVDTVTIATGNDTTWTAISVEHVSGSSNYLVRWRKENATTWNSHTLSVGVQIPVAGTDIIYLGSDPFAENTVDSDVRGWNVVASTFTDAQLLTITQGIDLTPSPTPLHSMHLIDATSGATNSGTAANWGVTGTLLTAATQPTEGGAPQNSLFFGAGTTS